MADAFDDENEQTVTIGEYIEGIEAEELEADLVLGGDEGKECTYSNGYMKRQAVFSCLTCVPDGKAGVCTACSLTCHDGHEVVELWTKRNLRCDCGNSKFGEFCCKLCPDKDPENVDNSYNQNFKGSYCTCARPYPDPQTEEQVEMIQCCICEDWFHENHLGLNSVEEIPRDDEGEPLYEEFICQDCAIVCSFLKLYPSSVWANLPVVKAKEENGLEHGISSCSYSGKIENDYPAAENDINSTATHSELDVIQNEKDLLDDEKTAKSLDKEKHGVCFHDTTSRVQCILGVDINAASLVLDEKKPMFLSKKWRELLCRCRTCCKFYNQKGIDHLIDKYDSIEEYEKIAKEKRDEKLQQREGAEMNFLSTLNHVQKIEIMSGIADMKNEFRSFLESFDSSKPVTSDDVRRVFENLAKKKQRLE
ncbi:putative E3 ubiquitin-protein ligase UBR7 [Iris pallida]|uniref:E3 ubiquitin-protein ligase UBR7 n=1 Tax=Iris pallida TaxID=29817 RepID=A0AAX6DKW7_IRIPA|nr:putative E3 ubiquitin-protein ligase UBR7 [Iris pallida]